MPSDVVQLGFEDSIATIVLNDPDRRNAMSIAMFDGLDAALSNVAARDDTHVLLLRGNGKAFCAGFELGAAVDDPTVMRQYIDRLSATIRTLRRLPQVVVAAVHGAAIAGGCAMVSACDIVIASATTKFGYPVHKLGVSPAVNITTLQQAIGPGGARSLLMSGQLIDAATAHRQGLVHHLMDNDEAVLGKAVAMCKQLTEQSPQAMRVTKHWLNKLDGSLDDDLFDGPRDGSTEIAGSDEVLSRLREAWPKRG